MNLSRITSGLQRLFGVEGHRIVFWHDPAREFEDALDTLGLDGIALLRLDQVPALQAKIRIERDEPVQQFLLYAPFEEPDPEADWLLDIRLYGRSFRADRASLLLDDLGLAEKQHLRAHLAARAKFLAAKDRLGRLKRLVEPQDGEADLDRKMLAVAARAEQPTLFAVVQTLFQGMAEGFGSLDQPPEAWNEVERYGLADPFWRMVEETFGYADEKPSLKTFLLRLLVTDFAHTLAGPAPSSLHHLMLPPNKTANAIVCLAQWRDSTIRGSSYEILSALVASEIKLDALLEQTEAEKLGDVMTFADVEKQIIKALRDRVYANSSTLQVEEIRSLASRRKDGFWCSSKLPTTDRAPRRAFAACHDALIAAAELFTLRQAHAHGFDFPTAEAFHAAYVGEMFRFDQLYRLFSEAAEQARALGWDVLKPLREKVEDVYSTSYMAPLALRWGKHVAGLLPTWRISGVPSQYEFYRRFVAHERERLPNRKVFVIVSDAFRYEAAEELARDLKGTFRFKAELTSQLGVLPSFTSLGMAALLPHKQLAFAQNGDVLIEGQPSASTDQRAKILQSVEGTALQAKDLLAMPKQQGRDAVRPWRVVYIYHNRIDARGDDQKTEDEAFRATRETIRELGQLTRRIINDLNGSYVVITADHGFLFQETPPNLADKSVIAERPAGAIKWKKRYVLGRSLPDSDQVWHGTTANTARAAGEMEFLIPKGANRFHFTGGARFIHGGAMPQEIVVPVITVRELEGKSAEPTQVRSVPVHVLGGPHRITTSRHRFKLMQMEAVSERVKPLTTTIAVYQSDQAITNVETVTFDSESDKVDDRIKSVFLTLAGRKYDKRTDYQLIVRNADTGVEEQRVDVTIDLTFADDF